MLLWQPDLLFTEGLKDLKAFLALGTEDVCIVSSNELSYVTLGSST
jgi:hypothetical protein